MNGAVIVLLILIALLQFATLLAVCPTCRRAFSTAWRYLAITLAVVILGGFALSVGAWTVRNHGEEIGGIVAFAVFLGVVVGFLSLLAKLDSYFFMGGRLKRKQEKQARAMREHREESGEQEHKD
ncbi:MULTISPECIES: hypothetical protein [unclassified Thioalkalivibrio]|uniref:hypothetical protein n=1 Tax=unclassified Thioalkalivibrio TaxID=2621013 RepID=UPI000372BE58|nr:MULTISPECIES: hypothetical protein [unclassified Thioalkalivibrio]